MVSLFLLPLFLLFLHMAGSASSADCAMADVLESLPRPEDVAYVEIVVPYSEPLHYRITKSVPVREIVEGLAQCTRPHTVSEERPVQYQCRLLIVPKPGTAWTQTEIPLAAAAGLVPLSVGEPPLELPARFKNLLELILQRLIGVKQVATSDEELPGGFSGLEIMHAHMIGGLEFTLMILSAMEASYRNSGQLSNDQKVELWAVLGWEAAVLVKSYDSPEELASSQYFAEITRKQYDFIEAVREDTWRSVESGGLPYGLMVEIGERKMLGWVYECAHMFDKALVEFEKVDALLTPEVLDMATNEPCEAPGWEWRKESTRKHLEWVKTERIPEAIARCKEELNRRAEAGG